MYETPKKFLALRLRQIADTQVDTVFYCTGATGLFLTHFPQVGELVGDSVAPRAHGITIRDSMAALQNDGYDPLNVAADYCHQHGIEIFWSLRMNDVHDAFTDWLLPRYKREHPDWCLGTAVAKQEFPQSDPRWWWSALNYGVPEVRDLVFRMFEDVCGRYDVDGIELDFFRAPMFFKPTLLLNPVDRGHVEAMTDLVRRIRQLTERVGRRRGRPILVACRVPMDVQQSLDIGLNVRAWLEEDLFDLMVLGGGYAPMAMAGSVRKMVRLGHRFDVPVYPCISQSGMRGDFSSIEAWRGAAMNIWHTGADGVYTFNLFPGKPDDRFSQLGDVVTLKGRDKVYGVDTIPASLRSLGVYKPGLFLPDRLPVALKLNATTSITLPVGEVVVANRPPDRSASVRLQLRIANVVAGDAITVKVNGSALQTGAWDAPPTTQPASRSFRVELDPAIVQAGTNRVEIRLAAKSRADRHHADLVGLTMPVRYE